MRLTAPQLRRYKEALQLAVAAKKVAVAAKREAAQNSPTQTRARVDSGYTSSARGSPGGVKPLARSKSKSPRSLNEGDASTQPQSGGSARSRAKSQARSHSKGKRRAKGSSSGSTGSSSIKKDSSNGKKRVKRSSFHDVLAGGVDADVGLYSQLESGRL